LHTHAKSVLIAGLTNFYAFFIKSFNFLIHRPINFAHVLQIGFSSKSGISLVDQMPQCVH
jgi:hypothetical protein